MIIPFIYTRASGDFLRPKFSSNIRRSCCIIHVYLGKTHNTNTQMLADSVVSDTNRLLISWLRFFDTRKEAQFLLCWSYYADYTQRAAHLVMFKISVGRDPKKTTITSTVKSNSQRPNPTLTSMVESQLLNRLYFKFSGPSLPGITSSTLQPHFLYGGLLWQWWLSYPLCTSAKLHPMTMYQNS